MMKKSIIALTALSVMALSCQKEEHKSVVTFEQDEITVEAGASVYTYLLDGNGNYSWSFSEEGIAEVVTVKHGTVRIKGIAAGKTTLTLTDCKETSDMLIVNVTSKTE